MSQPAYNVPTNRYPKHPLTYMKHGEHPPCAQIGTEMYFTEPTNQHDRDQTEPVIKACHGCPIFDQCFDYALNVSVTGIWAGTTFAQRRRARVVKGIVPHSMSMEEFVPAVPVLWDSEAGQLVARD